MATYENATCHTRVQVRSCVSARVGMCAHVCACVCMNNKIAPVLGFLLSRHQDTTYILAHSHDFLSSSTIFLFSYAHVAWCRVERSIRVFNQNRRSSLKSGGMWHTLVCLRIILK